MLDIHAEALESVNEAVHTFYLRFRSEAKIVYGFVEGKEDPMFYRGLIDRFLPQDWNVDLIRSGRKAKVLEAFDDLDWKRFDWRRVAFFLDRDLDQIVRPQDMRVAKNVYITDGYSVENSVVDDRMFMRLLAEAYNIVDLSADEEAELSKLFRGLLQQFNRDISPIMGLIVHWRSKGITAHLDNLDLKLVFTFAQGGMVLTPACADPRTCTGIAAQSIGAANCTDDEYEHAMASFSVAHAPAGLTRGKYLIWFLAKALEHIHSEIGRFAQAYKNPPKPKAALGQANLMFTAAPRARCPESLRKFLDRTFLAYVGSRVEAA